ncbi:hypothetical protein CsatA_000201 [Cannabis sativa]
MAGMQYYFFPTDFYYPRPPPPSPPSQPTPPLVTVDHPPCDQNSESKVMVHNNNNRMMKIMSSVSTSETNKILKSTNVPYSCFELCRPRFAYREEKISSPPSTLALCYALNVYNSKAHNKY